jgi:hypothetical protein
MENYIKQLIRDFHQARCRIIPPSEIWDTVDMDDEGAIEDMAFAEECFYSTPRKISEITAISREQLPAGDLLTDVQANMLADEMTALLEHFNFYTDFPEKVPGRLRYKTFREIWDDEYAPAAFGEVHIELCDYEQETCPFPGFCSVCKEIEEERNFENRKAANTDFDDNDHLPF